jgi:hypothetical protein
LLRGKLATLALVWFGADSLSLCCHCIAHCCTFFDDFSHVLHFLFIFKTLSFILLLVLQLSPLALVRVVADLIQSGYNPGCVGIVAVWISSSFLSILVFEHIIEFRCASCMALALKIIGNHEQLIHTVGSNLSCFRKISWVSPVSPS